MGLNEQSEIDKAKLTEILSHEVEPAMPGENREVSTPAFKMRSELSNDTEIHQVVPLQELPVTEETLSVRQESAPVVNPNAAQEIVLDMLNGNRSIAVDGEGNLGTDYDQLVLGLSADVKKV
jgi:hypothetical protein